jgi:hypothetical protein
MRPWGETAKRLAAARRHRDRIEDERRRLLRARIPIMGLRHEFEHPFGLGFLKGVTMACLRAGIVVDGFEAQKRRERNESRRKSK